MRQRVMIAMALALRPDVLIADEPTTALDVTVQGEVLELLRDLQREQGTSVILITHDMGVVAEMADRVIVMRYGRMVEEGKAADIFARPQAAYTRELLAAVPRIGTGARRQGSSAGSPTSRPTSRRSATSTCASTCAAASSAGSTAASTPSKASASRSRRTRRWRWSANPAAASRRPPRRWPGWRPTAATSRSAGAIWRASTARRARRCAATCR